MYYSKKIFTFVRTKYCPYQWGAFETITFIRLNDKEFPRKASKTMVSKFEALRIYCDLTAILCPASEHASFEMVSSALALHAR